jgi:sugar/nucleoside kinase (ribokinase family)
LISLPLAIWAGSCSKLTDVNLPPGSASASAAMPVQVVDTLGAGDMFIARTLIGLLRGEAPQETLSAAAQAAAEACTRIGWTGYAAAMAIDVSHIPALKDIIERRSLCL